MFLKKLNNLHKTLALKMTTWYVGVFALSFIVTFVVVFMLIVAIVNQRMDDDLEEDIEDIASLLKQGGFDRIKEEMSIDTKGDEAEVSFFRVWKDRKLIFTTDLSSWQGLEQPDIELFQTLEDGEPILETIELPERDHSVRTVYGFIDTDTLLQVGETLENDEEFLATLFKGFLFILLVMILLGGPIGWFLAQRNLRGVQEVTKTATEIAKGSLDRRVPVSANGDELDYLAQAFNSMLDRIQNLIIGMREMTDNLAHDLRSPVARIRASAEMALNKDFSGTDWTTLANDTTEECDRLLTMINTTLDIAEAESGAAKLKISQVDLVDLVVDACDLFQTVAEDKQISLITQLPATCRIQADLQRLQRVVANLLDNAVKYTPEGGSITVDLNDDEQSVHLSITDTGVGISSNELPKIFQRYYRCDSSRSEYGNGLGLSLAQAFVRAHGGEVEVESSPGKGSTFTVRLIRSPYVG
ncbi:MAG: ATP-binding protein [Candidatus Thiodiazotropha sp.]